MSFRTDEVAQIDERGEVRRAVTPAKVEMELGEFRAVEGDTVKVRAIASVRLADTEADRRMFRETLGAGRRVVRAGDFAGVWAVKVREALVDLALPVETWLRGDASVLERAQRVVAAEAYLAGLEMLEPVRVEAASPGFVQRLAEESHRRAREDEAARVAAAREAEAARRVAEMERAAQVIKAAKEAGTEVDELARHAGTAAPVVRAAAHAEEAAGVVWCVAGGALVKLGEGEPEVREIPADLGALRSVSVWGSEIYVGARDGVWRVGETVTPLADESMASEHGFSEVVRTGDIVWGLHRQRGLVWWGGSGERLGCIRPTAVPPAARTALPTMMVTGMVKSAGGVEGMSALAPGRRAASVLVVGERVEEIGAGGEKIVGGPVSSRCLAVAELDHRVAAVCEDGVVRWYDGPELKFAGEIRLGDSLSAAGVWRTRLGVRLLAATAGGPVIVIDERGQELQRLTSAHRGLKAIVGNGATVAGVSADRMRVIVWTGDRVREVAISTLVRGRVADVAVG